MEYKIKEIKEKVPQVTTLPDGYYNGIWGAYVIEVHYKQKTYELTTEEGVRGIGIPVIVEIKEGVATFSQINK